MAETCVSPYKNKNKHQNEQQKHFCTNVNIVIIDIKIEKYAEPTATTLRVEANVFKTYLSLSLCWLTKWVRSVGNIIKINSLYSFFLIITNLCNSTGHGEIAMGS